MAKDYKKSRKKRERPALFGNLLAFVAGLSVGLLIAFFVLLRSQLPESVMSSPAPAAEAARNQPTNAAQEQKLTFDFYDVLSNRKLNISEWAAKDEDSSADAATSQTQEQASAAQPTQPGQAQQPENDVYGYVLQVGSFKDFNAADQVKAELALMGIFADVQRVMLNGQNTVHRVRLGPYKNMAEMEKMRARLEASQVEFILLELRLAGDSA